MKKLFHISTSVRTDSIAQELQDARITKKRLQAILCELPARKRTVLLINDLLHEEQLPIQDVGLALGVAAARVIIAEKAGREFTEEGRDLLMEEGRLLFLEGLRPFFEENLGHIISVFTAFFGSVLGGAMLHVPFLQVIGQVWSGIASASGPGLTSLIPAIGYSICLACGSFLGRKSEA